MNKFFTKVATLSIGLAMAIGVGVAVGSKNNDVKAVKAAGTEVATGDLTSEPSYTGGTGTQSATKKNGYHQDASGTTYFQVLSNTAWWTSTPNSISFTANLAGGSAKDPLTNNVQVQLLGSGGTTLGSATTVTTKVTATSTPYAVSIPVQNNVYGVKLSHVKESGFNVRFYSFSLSYEAGSSGKTNTTTEIVAAGNKTTLDITSNPADTVQLTATAMAGDTTVTNVASDFTWASSDEDVITVDSSGLVTAVAKGTAQITADYKGDTTYDVSSNYIDIKVINPNETVFNFATLAAENSWANGSAYTPVVVDGTTLSTTSGGNNAKYYSSDSTWRMYNGGSLTITPPSGKSISAVESVPSQTFIIANDGSSATKSFTSNVSFKSITVTLAAAKVLDSISASLTDSEKAWRVNDTVVASDLTIIPHYTDGSDGTAITDGTGVTVTNGSLINDGDNTVNVSYGGKATTVTVNAKSSTVVAWTITGEIGDTVKSTAYNLNGLTLHAWYDTQMTDEASASVAALYELVADPALAGDSENPSNTITVKVRKISDSSIVETFENVSAPIINSPAGSEENPYSVMAARTYASGLSGTDDHVSYITGIVSAVSSDAYNSTYGNKTFWITDDGIDDEDAELEIWRAYYTDAETKMTEEQFNSINVGDRVTICGYLKNYSGTLETDQKAYVYAHTQETKQLSLSVSADTLTLGSSFSYSGTVTTAFTVRSNFDVTASVTYSGYDLNIVGSPQTVTVTYNDSIFGDITATYTLTIQYAEVSAVTIDGPSAVSMTQDSSRTFTASLNPNTDPSSVIAWSASSATLIEGSSNDYEMSGGVLTVHTSKTGTINVVASCDEVTSDPVVVTVTGNPVPSLDAVDLYGFVGNEDIDISVTGVAGGVAPFTYKWLITGAAGVASIDSEYGDTDDAALLDFVGRGDTVVTVTVTDANSKQGTASANIHVTEHLNDISGSTVTPGTATWTVAMSQTIHPSGSANNPVDNDIDSNIHFTGSKGTSSTDFRHWSDGIRCYDGNTVTFTPSNDAVIKTITLPTVGGTCSDLQATKSGDVWTIKNGASPITFTSLSKGTISSDIVVTYEIKKSGGVISDTNYFAQKAAVEFAEDLTSKLNAVCLKGEGGTTVIESLNTAWSNIQATYNAKRSSLSSTDRDVFDMLIANATANENGDCLQKALRSYEWVYAKYHASLTAGDFLSTNGRASVNYAFYIPSVVSLNNNNATLIIIVASIVSLTAVGGYFLFKKKKQY